MVYDERLQPIDGVGRSSQASSLLRIPPVMDNKPQYANANRGSKVRSSFANPGTFRPEVPPDEGEHMRRQSLQRAESMGFPQDIQSNLDDTDLQSFRTSRRKDFMDLQTQEFMYSPSLARTTTELSLDGEGQAKLQSTVLGMAEAGYVDQSSRPPFQQLVFDEYVNEELPFEDPTYQEELPFEDPTYKKEPVLDDYDNEELPFEDPTCQEDFFVDNGDNQEEVQASLQQQSNASAVGAFDENDLNDEECFDDALAETQHDDAGIVLSEGKDDYVVDAFSLPAKDGLHSGSFANLEQPLGSFKRAFGSSSSFVKVPFGASELSYEGFAKVQFVEPTAGIWPFVWKSVAMQDLIRFSKDPLTQPLMQRLAAAPHKQCAITSFTHLLAYMGDVPTHQDLVYHVQQILMMGIKFSEFRDEIFCQICKQTTANPSRWSNGRGWQAMALCVGTFGPSSTFRPFLEAHLQQVASNFVGQWAGDTMSYQDEGMSNPSKAAQYCLLRLQKLLQAGSRRLPPLHAEINAVEKMETIRVNIYLPDDSFKVLELDPMATAEEAVRDVAYGVYPVEEHDAVMLGALQLRADSSFFENLEESLTDDVIRKFGPKIYVEGSEREWKVALLRTAAALPPEEDMSICINDYIDFLRSRCTLYGSCLFYVKVVNL